MFWVFLRLNNNPLYLTKSMIELRICFNIDLLLMFSNFLLILILQMIGHYLFNSTSLFTSQNVEACISSWIKILSPNKLSYFGRFIRLLQLISLICLIIFQSYRVICHTIIIFWIFTHFDFSFLMLSFEYDWLTFINLFAQSFLNAPTSLFLFLILRFFFSL